MKRNEKQTRQQLIDPKLKLAGWEVLSVERVIEKNKACIEIPVTGMTKSSTNPSGNGFVDYVLFGDDCKPLAVIEAKRSTFNEEQGRVQAILYADVLEKQYGVRPVIYYTNGYDIKIIDGIYPARRVHGFHKKDELEYIIQKRNHKLVETAPNAAICGRYYQMDAISEIIKHLGEKHSRSLIVLATGTGKTRTACGLSEIFIRNNFVKRILFLADRKNLVTQAKEETFDKYLPTIPMATIIEGKHDGAKDARIVFSTYQSMLSLIRDETKAPFGIGHFDLIIVDEAHRSLFNKYAEIFDYFDSLMVGLTATPRNDIHKSTYKVFNLDTDAPNYEYDLVKAVKDGYLNYFRALDRTPDILKDGISYDDLSEEDKEQYEEVFEEEDGTLPEKIEGKMFYSYITNKGTIRAVLQTLMDEGLRVNNGDTLGKTIIFARDHNHALLIQEEFRNMYPHLCRENAQDGVDYCVVIDNKIRYNDVLQREFKANEDIRIVVSVDMMDTGVDIPGVVNLVFFKKVLSKIKFWQMIGRGTRLCPGLKIMSPSKVYFERQTNDRTRQFYEDKQGFLIFDICNVFNFFKLNPDGKEDGTDQPLSLNQQIFVEKAALYKAMQFRYAMLDVDERKFYVKLRDELISKIKNLNRNYIGVQKNLKYIEKYSELDAWSTFLQPNLIEVKKYIAPCIEDKIDFDAARTFDYLAYKFSATKLLQHRDFVPTAKSIYNIADYLHNKKIHLSEVSKNETTLKYIKSNDFIMSTTVCEMEKIRLIMRDLMKYLDKEDIIGPIVDFDDKISSDDDADDMAVDFSLSIDDFKSFEEKVFYYLSINKNKPLVEKIINLQPYTIQDITEVKNELISIAATEDEYLEMFEDNNSLISFIRRNLEFNPIAISNFLNEQRLKGRNDEQIEYIESLLMFIGQNGEFNPQFLFMDGLNHFDQIFDSKEIRDVMIDFSNIM